jgi:hypothetical protein
VQAWRFFDDAMVGHVMFVEEVQFGSRFHLERTPLTATTSTRARRRLLPPAMPLGAPSHPTAVALFGGVPKSASPGSLGTLLLGPWRSVVAEFWPPKAMAMLA